MIDWERIEELRREIGVEGLREVARIFLEEGEETLGELAALQEGSERAMKLHFLKGSALDLGLTDLAALCQRAERDQGAIGNDEIALAFAAACRELASGLSAAA